MKSLLPLFAVLIALAAAPGESHTTLRIHKKPAVFTATEDGRHGHRPVGVGWRDVGRTIPMSGGTITSGGFFVNLTVGTAGPGGQGVQFEVLVDTGSSNTAIPMPAYNPQESPTSKPLPCNSSMCQNCIPTAVGSGEVPIGPQSNASCLYGPPTCHKDQCSFAISYGGSSSFTQGVTVQDTACIGSVCGPDVYLGAIPSSPSSDGGIIGLAFPHNSCTPSCQPTILDMFVEKGVLAPEENGFGMCLTPDDGGLIDLGFVNTSRIDSNFLPLSYTKVTHQHWYNIEIKAIKVMGIPLDVPPFLYNIVNDGIGAFPDSGTTILILSPVAFKQLQNLMLGEIFQNLKGVKTLFGEQQCVSNLTKEDIVAYPDIAFTIAGMEGVNGDFDLQIDGFDYLMPMAPHAAEHCLGIAGVPSIGVILGDVVMQSFYIHFDRHNSRVGFGALKTGACRGSW